MGIQDVIVLKYDWVAEIEVFYYSKEWGWIKWENYTVGGVLKAAAFFNKIDVNPPTSVYANNLCLRRDEYKIQFPNLICTPGSVRDCKVCNANGSAWVNDNSKCVKVSGKIIDNQARPISNVKISVSGYGDAITDDQGEWSVFLTPSAGYSVRIGSGLPAGYKSIVANSNRSCNASAGSYEWQRAGRDEFIDCTKGEIGSWDLASDNNFDFIINYPVCAANAVSGCKVCKTDGLGWTDVDSKCTGGQTCQSGICVANCVAKTCASLGNYQCGSWSDGCSNTINCGACATGKSCNTSGQCVASGGGPANPPVINPPVEKQISKMTRVQIIAKINEIVALIAQLQEQLKAMMGGKTIYSCVQITKNLYYGMKNDADVKCLQEVLKEEGYAVGVSGNYDLATKNAVAKFQQKYASEILFPYGLRYGSGNAGNATMRKINILMAQ